MAAGLFPDGKFLGHNANDPITAEEHQSLIRLIRDRDPWLPGERFDVDA